MFGELVVYRIELIMLRVLHFSYTNGLKFVFEASSSICLETQNKTLWWKFNFENWSASLERRVEIDIKLYWNTFHLKVLDIRASSFVWSTWTEMFCRLGASKTNPPNIKQKVDIGKKIMCECDISKRRQRIDLKFECVIFKIEKTTKNRKSFEP